MAFWAVWLLVMHYVDVFWLVMPNYSTAAVSFGLIETLCLLGLGSWLVAAIVHSARRQALVPLGDPRLGESVGFENI